MRIVHYIFGIPPLRGGGTIKYAIDLAKEQSKQGHEVFLLYPGEIEGGEKPATIKKTKPIQEISVFEIINPLPVSLVTGINKPAEFMKQSGFGIFEDFFRGKKIDVLHVHSIMGLYIEVLQAAKNSNVKIFYTSHDYFGLCPKTNLIRDNVLCDDINWTECIECCKCAEDVNVLIKRQKHWFQYMIKCKILVYLKGLYKKYRQRVNVECSDSISYSEAEKRELQNEYKKLKEYYEKELQLVDVVLYNSSITKREYEKRINISKSYIVGSMHSDIRDRRCIRNVGDIVRFAYLGYPESYKGYHKLIEAMDELHTIYPGQFVLNTYMNTSSYVNVVAKRPYIRDHYPYEYKEIDKVFNNMDILIVPSICAETFGFVVLEAISYGVPVIVSDTVGATDLLRNENELGIIVSMRENKLINSLKDIMLDKTIINRMNRNICSADLSFEFSEHVSDIVGIYKKESLL